MQSAMMLAELLEEKAAEAERVLPEDRVLHSTMREAAQQLREQAGKRPLPLLTREGLDRLPGTLTRMDIAMYLEMRGLPTVECAIVYSIQNEMVCMRMTNGERRMLDIKYYGKTWQLWERYPSGEERTKGKMDR